MKQSLTPYVLTIGPIIAFLGFMLFPVGDDVYGQEYLNELEAADPNMVSLATIFIVIGIISIIGSFFLLSQDMMSNVGKTQQDMLMLARVAS